MFHGDRVSAEDDEGVLKTDDAEGQRECTLFMSPNRPLERG